MRDKLGRIIPKKPVKEARKPQPPDGVFWDRDKQQWGAFVPGLIQQFFHRRTDAMFYYQNRGRVSRDTLEWRREWYASKTASG